MGPRTVGGPKFRAFFSLSHNFLSSWSWGALKCLRLGSRVVVWVGAPKGGALKGEARKVFFKGVGFGSLEF